MDLPNSSNMDLLDLWTPIIESLDVLLGGQNVLSGYALSRNIYRFCFHDHDSISLFWKLLDEYLMDRIRGFSKSMDVTRIVETYSREWMRISRGIQQISRILDNWNLPTIRGEWKSVWKNLIVTERLALETTATIVRARDIFEIDVDVRTVVGSYMDLGLYEEIESQILEDTRRYCVAMRTEMDGDIARWLETVHGLQMREYRIYETYLDGRSWTKAMKFIESELVIPHKNSICDMFLEHFRSRDNDSLKTLYGQVKGWDLGISDVFNQLVLVETCSLDLARLGELHHKYQTMVSQLFEDSIDMRRALESTLQRILADVPVHVVVDTLDQMLRGSGSAYALKNVLNLAAYLEDISRFSQEYIQRLSERLIDMDWNDALEMDCVQMLGILFGREWTNTAQRMLEDGKKSRGNHMAHGTVMVGTRGVWPVFGTGVLFRPDSDIRVLEHEYTLQDGGSLDWIHSNARVEIQSRGVFFHDYVLVVGYYQAMIFLAFNTQPHISFNEIRASLGLDTDAFSAVLQPLLDRNLVLVDSPRATIEPNRGFATSGSRVAVPSIAAMSGHISDAEKKHRLEAHIVRTLKHHAALSIDDLFDLISDANESTIIRLTPNTDMSLDSRDIRFTVVAKMYSSVSRHLLLYFFTLPQSHPRGKKVRKVDGVVWK